MSKILAGFNFDLLNNGEILKLNSPKSHLKGPYSVIYKDLNERWALVAMDWDDKPRLGYPLVSRQSREPPFEGICNLVCNSSFLNKNPFRWFRNRS